MLDFSARASPSLRNPTSFCYKSLLFGELLQVAIAICEFMFFAHENTGYTHFTVAQKGNLFDPETFIYENSKRYISEQTLLDVKDIIIKPIK